MWNTISFCFKRSVLRVYLMPLIALENWEEVTVDENAERSELMDIFD